MLLHSHIKIENTNENNAVPSNLVYKKVDISQLLN